MLCIFCFLLGPTAPKSLMVVNFTDTTHARTVTLSWMPPDPPNGIITQYQVRYRRRGSNDIYLSQNIVNTNLTYTVTNLINIEYELQIRAFTVVGNGVYSDLVFVRPGKLSNNYTVT